MRVYARACSACGLAHVCLFLSRAGGQRARALVRLCVFVAAHVRTIRGGFVGRTAEEFEVSLCVDTPAQALGGLVCGCVCFRGVSTNGGGLGTREQLGL